MKKVLHVVGARPNYMKVAPIYKAIARQGLLSQVVVHTGQHYGAQMSDVFFSDLGIPSPDVHLNVGSGSHAETTARVMIAMETVCLEQKPDLVSVVGDVNSTVATALVTTKLNIPLAHVEAGLRSGDRRMPEEVNRLVVDRLADLLLTPSPDGDANLLREGVDKERICFVGNVMIDSMLQSRDAALRLPTLQHLGLVKGEYGVCTLHRPSNVDDPQVLGGLLGALASVSRRLPVVFPVHPRTRKMIEECGLRPMLDAAPGLLLREPLGYLEFLSLTSQARLILTDSGGLQEESTALGIPCLTLRENTERPITVDVGTNLVVGTDPDRVRTEAFRILDGKSKRGRVPDKWDGKAGERIAELYATYLGALGVDLRMAA
jgi:UDP-N-acetylglucosamine 2-epimerase (non-hydrolysing)